MGPLTRSRIEGFDQTATALSELAGQLRTGATRWQQATDGYVEQIDTPNGTEWTGQAATRYFDEARADRLVVNTAVGHAHSMADVADLGADSLRGVRTSALEAIAQAEEDDFAVGEDLSITDKSSSNSSVAQAARQQAALAHRNYIVHCAARLEAEDVRVAAKLHAGAAELTGMIPGHWQKPATGADPLVQAAGYGISPAPTGPIIWCLQPGGTYGKWRCSVLYPDLSTATYWSFTDDTGGSLP